MEVVRRVRASGDPHLIDKFEHAVRIVERSLHTFGPTACAM